MGGGDHAPLMAGPLQRSSCEPRSSMSTAAALQHIQPNIAVACYMVAAPPDAYGAGQHAGMHRARIRARWHRPVLRPAARGSAGSPLAGARGLCSRAAGAVVLVTKARP